jgi:hypothetical protein
VSSPRFSSGEAAASEAAPSTVTVVADGKCIATKALDGRTNQASTYSLYVIVARRLEILDPSLLSNTVARQVSLAAVTSWDQACKLSKVEDHHDRHLTVTLGAFWMRIVWSNCPNEGVKAG